MPETRILSRSFSLRDDERDIVDVLRRNRGTTSMFLVNESQFVTGVFFGRLPEIRQLEAVTKFSHVKGLSFEMHYDKRRPELDAEYLRIVLGISTLRTLLVSQMPLTYGASQCFKEQMGLKWLRLRNCSLTDSHLAAISHCNTIESMTITNSSSLRPHKKLTADAVVNALNNMCLTSLFLNQHDFDLSERLAISRAARKRCDVAFFSRIGGPPSSLVDCRGNKVDLAKWFSIFGERIFEKD